MRQRGLGHWLMVGLAWAMVSAALFIYVRWRLREYRYTKLVAEIAPQYGVEPALVKAVMKAESGFDPFAESKAGAVGLMQVMPASGRLLGVRERDLWDERTNIITGTRLLADALAYWRGQAVDDPVPFALAEYNAGRPTVLKWAGSRQAAAFVAGLPNAGVRRYIERVLAYHAEYRAP